MIIGAKIVLIDIMHYEKTLTYEIFSSFHVGSGVTSPEAFARAIREAKMVFVEGSKLGFHMNTLDIGGGFPCNTVTKYCTLKFSKVKYLHLQHYKI